MQVSEDTRPVYSFGQLDSFSLLLSFKDGALVGLFVNASPEFGGVDLEVGACVCLSEGLFQEVGIVVVLKLLGAIIGSSVVVLLPSVDSIVGFGVGTFVRGFVVLGLSVRLDVSVVGVRLGGASFFPT